jgi:hypothetical protein
MTEFILWALIWGVVCAGISYAVCQSKNRPVSDGLLLGGLLGVIGLVIVLCLPKLPPTAPQLPPPPGWYPDPDNPGQPRWWDGVRWSPNVVVIEAKTKGARDR